MIVTVHEAKSQLSKLIKAVEAGEEVIIARRDKPVVALKPYQESEKPKPSDGAGGLAHLVKPKPIKDRPNEAAQDREIEADFASSEEDW